MPPPSEAAKIPVVLLGGTGYVAGELLRLLALHPRFLVAGVASASHAGESLLSAFPHLAGTAVAGLRFETAAQVQARALDTGPLGLFAALPHGQSASLVDECMARAQKAGTELRVVDLSADFRFSGPAAYAAVYGKAHGAPARCASFACALPEHLPGLPGMAVAHPGCFTTAVLLPLFPLFAADLIEEEVFVCAVTGSSGSGRTPSPKTHHPERSGNLYAYAPLCHRHEPEMRMLLERARPGCIPQVAFVPHSGPFVRGIHATLRATLRAPATAEAVASAIGEFYGGSPFVEVALEPPRLTDVVGTNRCRIGVAVRGRTAVLTSVLDNLIKGAAGGGVQWMNRLFGLEEDAGLRLPGMGYF